MSVKLAKHEFEQEQHKHAIELHNKTIADLAEQKVHAAKLQVLSENQLTEISRISFELAEVKGESKQLATLQSQLVELQKQLSKAQHDLIQSERERESLTHALRAHNKEF